MTCLWSKARIRFHRPILLFGVLLASVAGCTSLGPITIPGDRFNYNEAGAQSTKEQLLLNIVRLRYGEPAYFMELSSVLSQYTLQSGANFSTWWNDLNVWSSPALRAVYGVDSDPSKQTSWGANVTYTDRPTITYTPLQGEEFAKRLMTPIDPVTVIYLADAGWEIDRLLDCCVQRINGIPNPRLVRSDTARPAADGAFRRVAGLLRTVQEAGGLCFTVESDGQAIYLSLHQQATTNAQQELRELLGIPLDVDRLRLTSRPVQGAPDELAIQTRSLLATLNALSDNVVAPPDHEEAGKVVPGTAAGDGEPPEAWLRVAHSALPATDVFAQVRYNGYWFHIPQTDLRSKRTFALLSYLFSLQATSPRRALPLVTVPAG
jgi:predicted small lipoprotein YifL